MLDSRVNLGIQDLFHVRHSSDILPHLGYLPTSSLQETSQSKGFLLPIILHRKRPKDRKPTFGEKEPCEDRRIVLDWD